MVRIGSGVRRTVTGESWWEHGSAKHFRWAWTCILDTQKHQLENDYNNLTAKCLPENDWMVLKMAKSIATDGWATPVDPQLWTLAVDRRGGVACGTTTGWAEPVVPDSEGC